MEEWKEREGERERGRERNWNTGRGHRDSLPSGDLARGSEQEGCGSGRNDSLGRARSATNSHRERVAEYLMGRVVGVIAQKAESSLATDTQLW